MSDTHATVVSELRQALNRLSDSESLRQSPLIARLGLEHQEDPATALRAALVAAIESLRPVAGTSARSGDARLHAILFARYVEGHTQEAVAGCLGITPRHLRREQEVALSALARLLDVQYELGGGCGVQLDALGERGVSVDHSAEVNREMLWLADAHRHETSDVAPVLSEAGELVGGLAAERGVTLHLVSAPDVHRAHMPRTVLRQVVLNLLSAAVENLAPGGRVLLEARTAERHVVISMMVRRKCLAPWSDMGAWGRAIDVSRQLAQLFGGHLSVSEVDDLVVAKVSLPSVDQPARVLAIDDNTDTLRLWRRYVQRTRFTLIEANDPDEALAAAVKIQPALIVLDVMLPRVDGWELLRQFRHHVVTASIPIIVCTVLPQRQLALSLGAADFVQKPVTGPDFRAALERQIVAAEQRG